jgi:serine protease
MTKPSLICRLAAAAAGAALLGGAVTASAALVSGTGTALATRAPLSRPAAAASVPGATAASYPASAYVPGEVVVGYTSAPTHVLEQAVTARTGARVVAAVASHTELVHVPPGESVQTAVGRLRTLPGVAYAVPDFIAHAAGGWVPDDRGQGTHPRDWQLSQWNFLARAGVDAPDAWSNLRRAGAPGGRGVVVAIVDTGVAYRNWVDPSTHKTFRESPDFVGTRFVAPCDLVHGTISGLRDGQIAPTSKCTDSNAVDRHGHGTLVAGVVAETTNNGVGVTGLAYGASVMPVRVLDAQGNGDAITIARGIRYAAAHGARIINLSLEFDLSIGAADIPDVISAIEYAHSHGVIVVAAAGNEGANKLAYPARDPRVISVGATTEDRCLAYYSNSGVRLDLVAPGGGGDAQLSGDANCHPGRQLLDIYQMTFSDPSRPAVFNMPSGWVGTSMAAPHVAAAAALVIASRVLGPRPSPDRVLARLEATATPLGRLRPNRNFGYGLLDASKATARG